MLEAAPEKRGVVDDWNDLLREEKMVKFERDTGRCARCRQTLPISPRQGINRRPIDEFGFRVIAV